MLFLGGGWCDPGCPFCPPGLFGNNAGGGGGSDGSDDDDNDDDDDNNDDDDDDDDNSSTTTTTTTTPTYTAAGFHIDIDDSFPTLDNDAEVSELASVSDEWESLYSSMIATGTVTSTTTTKTQTSTETSTSTSSNPTPTDGAKFATFAIMEMWTGVSWLREWDILDTTEGVAFDPCEINPDISIKAYTVGADPNFPDQDIGPFESHGIEGCQYTAGKDDDTIGTMTCPGVDQITCRDPGDTTSVACDGGATVTLVFDCWW
jgi:chitinase